MATPQLFFQVGIVVTDLGRAMAELSAALGLSWTEPVDRSIDGDPVRVAFSVEGPPYIELIDGSAAQGVWAARGRPRIHHLAVWSDDFAGDCRRLELAGLHRKSSDESVDTGTALYESTVCGATVELLGTARRAAFEALVKPPISGTPN